MDLIEGISDNQVVAVLDIGWGDSGKGKISDYLASLEDGSGKRLFSAVYRPNGGPNTGHTVYHKGEKVVFHLIPSAALVPGLECIIGRMVSFDPVVFSSELENVKRFNPDPNIEIDGSAHVIMPWHIAVDRLREIVGSGSIGTTGKGVGPCMETRCSRKGFVTVDMLADSKTLENMVEEAVLRFEPEIIDLMRRLTVISEGYNDGALNYLATVNMGNDKTLKDFFRGDGRIDINAVLEFYTAHGTSLSKYILGDLLPTIRSTLEEGERILVEGTQGALLDISYGTYPYVTAGLVTRPGLEHDAGIPIDLGINVTKAYATRVGRGPFPTEILDSDLANRLREAGGEYGATTGRPRRVGWLDVVALDHALFLNHGAWGKRIVAVTKLDVLGGFKPRIYNDYKVDGSETDIFCYDEISRATGGSYIEFDEIEDVRGLSRFSELPRNASAYIDAIESNARADVILIGTGQGRHSVIIS